MLIAAAAVLAVGFLVCEAATVEPIPVEVEMKPTKIRLSDEGTEQPWLRCYIDVEGILTWGDVEVLKKRDVLLEGVLNPMIAKVCPPPPPDEEEEPEQLIVHFDLAAVKLLLAESGQMGEVELTVTITAGDKVLEGSDTVIVRK